MKREATYRVPTDRFPGIPILNPAKERRTLHLVQKLMGWSDDDPAYQMLLEHTEARIGKPTL